MQTSGCLVFLVWIGWIAASRPPVIQKGGADDHNQLVKAGEDKWLPCPVDSGPGLIVQWTKDGMDINLAWTRFREKEGGLRGGLKIQKVETGDAGLYVCRATNGYGVDEYTYRLFVISNDSSVTLPPDNKDLPNTDGTGESPTFLHLDQMNAEVLRPVGSTIRLKCAASGHPRPHISWYKDGFLLHRGDGSIGLNDNSDDFMWTLRLKDLRADDSGRYTCKVSNSHGFIEHTYKLEVIDRLQKPQIRSPHPRNVTVDYGDKALFQCKVHSEVKPTIQWLKRVDSRQDIAKRNTTIHMDGQHFIVLPSSEIIDYGKGIYVNKLTIQRAQLKDSGRYICLGVNSMGTSFRDAYLIVKSSGSNYDNPDFDEKSESDNKAHILIIAIPVGIVIAVVTIAIYCLYKKSRRNQQPKALGHPASVVNSNGKVITRPVSNSQQKQLPQHGYLPPTQDSSKHYYGYAPVPVHHHAPSHKLYPYLQHNGNMHSTANTEYEYPPLINNSDGLGPSYSSPNTSSQPPQSQQDVILTNYGEIHSEASSNPHNTTPNPSHHSSASSHTYMAPPSHPGLHTHNHYTVA